MKKTEENKKMKRGSKITCQKKPFRSFAEVPIRHHVISRRFFLHLIFVPQSEGQELIILVSSEIEGDTVISPKKVVSN